MRRCVGGSAAAGPVLVADNFDARQTYKHAEQADTKRRQVTITHLSHIWLARVVLDPHVELVAVLIHLVARVGCDARVVDGHPLLAACVQLLDKGAHLGHWEAVCACACVEWSVWCGGREHLCLLEAARRASSAAGGT